MKVSKEDIVWLIVLLIALYLAIKCFVISFNCPTCNDLDVLLKAIRLR